MRARVQSLSRRGLHQTALEVAKLSLMLDWRDPLGLTQTVDYYALRSRQFTFVEVGPPSCPAPDLPHCSSRAAKSRAAAP